MDSFGDFGEIVDSLTLLVAGGDFGDFVEGAAADDLALVVGETEGDRRDETGVGTFFVGLESGGSCESFFSGVVFLDSTDGDFFLGFFGICSSETKPFFSFSSFFATDLFPFSLVGVFGFPPSLF